jgi:hypothetical protein
VFLALLESFWPFAAKKKFPLFVFKPVQAGEPKAGLRSEFDPVQVAQCPKNLNWIATQSRHSSTRPLAALLCV